ncbi:MAG: hypothetical protein ACNA8W_24120, partial [Bradymonadaceae bacterium]
MHDVKQLLPFFAGLSLLAVLFVGCEPEPEQCRSNADCIGTDICHNGKCSRSSEPVPDAGDAGDAGVDTDDVDGQSNACGGSTRLSNQPGAPCGPCNLDEFVCEDADAVTCSGETLCPEMAIVTTLATEVTAHGATLHGRIQGLTVPPQADHGFCWGRGRAPDHEGECESLGAVEDVGEFSFTTETLLPGRTYHVRAFSTDTEGVHTYANRVELMTLAPTLDELTAGSDDSRHVLLTWDEMEGASTYVIWRDGEELETVTTNLFQDTTASPGTLTAPTDPVATGQTNGVTLQWSGSTGEPANEFHEYAVSVVYPNLTSELSSTAEGRRAAPPVQNYQVKIGDGAWQTVATTSFSDSNAPPPSITAGTASVEAGNNTVLLQVSGSSADPGPDVEYQIRAVGQGHASPAVSVTGARTTGALQYQWERSLDDTTTTFEPIAGATGPGAEVAPPALGETRHYRVRLSAPGAADVFADAGPFTRAGLPTVALGQTTGITVTGATLNAELTSTGSPPPTDHGFCWGLSTAPSLDVSSDAQCEGLGARTQTGPFSY